MDPIEALKNIHALVKVAKESDDIEVVRKHLDGIEVIVDKALHK
jgi:hypothetical protein